MEVLSGTASMQSDDVTSFELPGHALTLRSMGMEGTYRRPAPADWLHAVHHRLSVLQWVSTPLP